MPCTPSRRPGDAQAFGQGEGDLAPRLMGDLEPRAAWPRAAARAPTDSLRGTAMAADADQRFVERLRRCSSWLAPGQVFIVRCASGVTRIRQRPVGGPPARGAACRTAPRARACHGRRWRRAGRRRPGRRSRRCRPSAAAPAMLLAADPPLVSRAVPIAAYSASAAAVSSNCIDPLVRPCAARKSSSQVAITSTIASPIARMSSLAGSHRLSA